jgi:hypothetical protein
MKVEFISVSPNTQSINRELIFTFQISDIAPDKMPTKITGALFSEDNFKIAELKGDYEGNVSLWLNAEGSSNVKYNSPFQIVLSCYFTEKAIDHIEDYRLNKKENTKDIVFYAKLNIQMLESNIQLANFHFGAKVDGDKNAILYQFVKDYSTSMTNMWVLSANGGAHFLNQINYGFQFITIKIDLMEWVNKYTEYFNIGKFIVYEFFQPTDIPISANLKERFVKAELSLEEMRKQLNYGEWKQAVISVRPIFELFKNFPELKALLIDNGYTQEAYNEFKKTLDGFFGLLSKFYHALGMNNTAVNQDIPVEKEDAYLAYSFSISLLYLISQKFRKK